MPAKMHLVRLKAVYCSVQRLLRHMWIAGAPVLAAHPLACMRIVKAQVLAADLLSDM